MPAPTSKSPEERAFVVDSAVPSLGKLCEDHGYSHESTSGQTPRLTKEVKTFTCKTDNFVPLVVRDLSANSRSNSSSTSTLEDLSSTSPAQERNDGRALGNWCGSLENWMKVCDIFLKRCRRSQII